MTTTATTTTSGLTKREAHFVDHVLAVVALDATERERAAPTGARVLSAYELAATRDLLERLERVKRAQPTGEAQLGATATDGPIPASAAGADPAGVERAAP